MLFDKFDNKTVITGTITAIDPIHIGASVNEGLDPTQIDSSVLKDADGKPIIPGSSLKGVLRSNFEAVMRSIGENICDVLDSKLCCPRGVDASIKGERETAEEIYRKSCKACRLFGGHGMASKLQFKDCAYKGDKCIYEYRDGIGIDRRTGAVRDGAKFDYEIVPKGSEFSFYMTAENLDGEQEKQLDYIIRVLESGEISVGGFTTRGLGRIKLSDVSIERTDKEKLRELLGYEG